MKKLFFIFFFFGFVAKGLLADDVIQEAINHLKESRKPNKQTQYLDRFMFTDAQAIKAKLKAADSLTEVDFANFKLYFELVYKYYDSYSTTLVDLARLLPKDKLYLVKPLLIEILEKTKLDARRSILIDAYYFFDDYDGSILLKYRDKLENINDYVTITYITDRQKYNNIRYQTFRESYIEILDSAPHRNKSYLYRLLRYRFCFTNSSNIDTFDKLDTKEKEIEIQKMKKCLEETPDLPIAFEKFFKELQNEISKLNRKNYNSEMKILVKKWPFLLRMPSQRVISSADLFDKPDESFKQGLSEILEDFQIWFDEHKNDINYYSDGSLGGLVRSISARFKDQAKRFGSEISMDVDDLKERLARAKQFEKSDKKTSQLGASNLNLIVRRRIARTKSEAHLEFYYQLLEQLHELYPELYPSFKGGEKLLALYHHYLVLEPVEDKLLFNENGFNLKFTIVNRGKTTLSFAKDYSFAKNISLSINNYDAKKFLEIGTKPIEMVIPEDLAEDMTITLAPGQKYELILSDLALETKDLELPDGKISVYAKFYNLKGKDFAYYTSSILEFEVQDNKAK